MAGGEVASVKTPPPPSGALVTATAPVGATSTPVPMPNVWSKLNGNVSVPSLGWYSAFSAVPRPSAAVRRLSRP